MNTQKALRLAMGIMANHKELTIDKEQFEKAHENLNKILQENSIVAGICINILLDRLEKLSTYKIVWAKELKRFGNLFREKLAEIEYMIWQNISEDAQQNNFFASSAEIDKSFGKIAHFTSEQIFTLMFAINDIEKGDILQVENQDQIDLLKQGARAKESIKEQIINYLQSNPRISTIETLQFIRTL